MSQPKVLLSNVLFLAFAGQALLRGESPLPVVPEWTAHFDFPVHAIDEAWDVVCDASGNTYVGGRSSRTDSPTDHDWLVVAYGPGGDRLWTARHGGPAGWDDSICGIALSPDGSICLAGSLMTRVQTASDFAAVKYDTAGREIWATRHPRERYDEASAMTVDPSGNVYVTGSAMVDYDYRDFLTVKFGPDGRVLWEALHDGPAHRSDQANAITLGPGGTVIVAGGTEIQLPGGEPGETYSSCAVVAYRPDGTVAWENKRPCTDSVNFTLDSVAVASSGVVYVTGVAGLGLLTIALDQEGRILWEDAGATGDLAGSVAVDRDGNVYVAGLRSITRYTPGGKKVWVRQPPGDGAWGALRHVPLVLDDSGSITSFLEDQEGYLCVARHSPDGTEVWRSRFPARYSPGLAVDETGNARAVGTISIAKGDMDGIVATYGTDGLPLWSNVYDGAGSGNEIPASLALDSKGGAMVAATIEAGYQGDITVVRLASSGDVAWTARWGLPEGGGDRASRAVMDLEGNVAVLGVSGGAEPYLPQRFFVLKYDPGGELLWSAVSGRNLGLSQTRDIILDADGSVAVAVYGFSSGQPRATVMKYRADGTEAWSRSEAWAFPSVAAAGEGGRICLAGKSTDDAEDFLIWKYDAGGNLMGRARHDGGGRDLPLGLALDKEGNAWVAGESVGSDSRRLVLLRFGPGGEFLWERGFAGSGVGVALDPAGNPCIAGVQFRPDRTRNIVIAKYDRDGGLLWLRNHGEEGANEENVRGIAIDPAGNIYVCCDRFNQEGFDRISLFLKYGQEGDLLWSGSEGNIDDIVFKIDAAENIIVSGTILSPPNGKDLVVQKISTRAGAVPFIRGDCDGDGVAGGSVTDVIFLLDFNFLGGERPPCLSACDANGDGWLLGEVTDAIYLLWYSFLGGPPPPAPFPFCGIGPDDGLGCSTYPGCPRVP